MISRETKIANDHKSKAASLVDRDESGVKPLGPLRKWLLTPIVCSVLAGLGIFGGVSSLFAGIICAVIYSVAPDDGFLNRASTVLLVIAIPMILVGSIFLDEIEP